MRSLGLDIGTTNVKAVAVEIDSGRATVVAQATAPTPTAGGTLIETVARLVAETGAGAASVGIASMAETGVPLDGDGAPLGDLVRWDAGSSQQYAEALARTHGAGALFAATGVRPSGKVPLATWARLRAEEPGRWAAMARWAGVADLVALALTGRLVTDHTLAGRTMAYRLPVPGASLPEAFDAELLSAVSLRTEQLPEVVPAGELAGRVGAAGTWGLRPGAAVVVAGHDHPVGTWAAGVRRPGEVADSVGTAEAVARVIAVRPEPAEVAGRGMSLVRTVEGDHDALVAGSASAGAVLADWAERLGGYRALAPLLDAAAGLPRRAGSPVLLPYLSGRQAPAPDPTARPRLLGHGPHDDAARTAAVVDGLALHARWMLTAGAELAEQDPAAGEVAVLGAAVGTGSAWLRAKVAAGPAPVRVVSAGEPVAVGAAVLAAHRAGLAAPVVLDSAPAPGHREPVYDDLFARFLAAATA